MGKDRRGERGRCYGEATGRGKKGEKEEEIVERVEEEAEGESETRGGRKGTLASVGGVLGEEASRGGRAR